MLTVSASSASEDTMTQSGERFIKNHSENSKGCVDCLWKRSTPQNHKCGGDEKNEIQKPKQPPLPCLLIHSFTSTCPMLWPGLGKNWEQDKNLSPQGACPVFLTLNQTSSLWRTNRTDPHQRNRFLWGSLTNLVQIRSPLFPVLFIIILIVNPLHLPFCMTVPCALS